MDTAETIGRGGEPAWQHTFPHPKHGDLTFTVARTPVVQDWLDHAVVQETIAPGLTGFNGVLSAAVAGMRTFVKCPVVDRVETEDENTPGHVIVELIRYDPLQDEDLGFPMLVWGTFMKWRADALSDDTRDAVKNGSGATPGQPIDGLSPAPTASPQTTHV